MKEERKVKRLKSQLTKMTGDLEALKIEMSNKQKEYALKKKHIKEIQTEINRFENNQKIKFSEHALVRYFERIKGYDLEEVKKEILTEEALELINKLGGNGSYPNGEFNIVLRNYTIVTIK